MRRARSRSDAHAVPARRGPRCDRDVLQGDHRRHRRPGVRVQAADRLLRQPRRRAGARADLPLRARDVPGRHADPRRQAGRHRLDGEALCRGGVRAIRRACRHGQPVPRHRLDRAVLRARRRDHRAVPHEQPGWRRHPVARRRRVADLRPRRPPGRRRLVETWRLRARRRRHLSDRTGRRPSDRARRADPRPGGRSAGRRRGDGGRARRSGRTVEA